MGISEQNDGAIQVVLVQKEVEVRLDLRNAIRNARDEAAGLAEFLDGLLSEEFVSGELLQRLEAKLMEVQEAAGIVSGNANALRILLAVQGKAERL